MKRKPLSVFIVWQGVGVLGACLWQALPTPGAAVWAAGFLFLLPGNLLAGKVVEYVFWRSGLSLRAIGVIELALAIAINYALWLGVTLIVRPMRSLHVERVGREGSIDDGVRSSPPPTVRPPEERT